MEFEIGPQVSRLTFRGGLRGCVEPMASGKRRKGSESGSKGLEGPPRGPWPVLLPLVFGIRSMRVVGSTGALERAGHGPESVRFTGFRRSRRRSNSRTGSGHALSGAARGTSPTDTVRGHELGQCFWKRLKHMLAIRVIDSCIVGTRAAAPAAVVSCSTNWIPSSPLLQFRLAPKLCGKKRFSSLRRDFCDFNSRSSPIPAPRLRSWAHFFSREWSTTFYTFRILCNPPLVAPIYWYNSQGPFLSIFLEHRCKPNSI